MCVCKIDQNVQETPFSQKAPGFDGLIYIFLNFYCHHYFLMIKSENDKKRGLFRFLRSANTSGQEAGTLSGGTSQRHFSWLKVLLE